MFHGPGQVNPLFPSSLKFQSEYSNSSQSAVLTATAKSMEMAEIRPLTESKPTDPIARKFVTVDYVREMAPCNKFHANPSMETSRQLREI